MLKHLPKAQKAVAVWLLTGVVMLLIQVILGGITRLTGSGLSITEWNVLSSKGFLPPMNAAQWSDAFEKYQHTPQYRLLNAGFSLQNFKFIYFWEWFHREWARLIAVVFLVGFVYLLAKRYLHARIIRPLLILFMLGALQGAIGWIMVKSGLTDDMIYVKPLKLALHFVFALVLISYAWWVGLEYTVPNNQVMHGSPSLRIIVWSILLLLFFQLTYGALMAGHKAATAAPTWPSINGAWLPRHLFSPGINAVENSITVHFIHRGLAYLLLIACSIFSAYAWRSSGTSAAFRKTRWLPLLLIILQAALGIATVLSSPYIVPNRWVGFDWLAQFHQVVALLFMLVMLFMLFITRAKRLAV